MGVFCALGDAELLRLKPNSRTRFVAPGTPRFVRSAHDTESGPNDTGGRKANETVLGGDADQFAAVLDAQFPVQLAAHGRDGGRAEVQRASCDGIVAAIADH